MAEVLTVEDIVQRVIDNIPDQAFPDPNMLNFYTFAKERKIFIEFDICDALILLQKLILRWNIEDVGLPTDKRKPIWVYILSDGGDLTNMWSFIDTMNASATPVYTVNIGCANSAAALIFISGKKRFMMKNSVLCVHEGQAEFAGDAVKVIDASDKYKKDLQKMKEYIEHHTSFPHKEIIKKRNNDWYIGAEEALKNGACEVIVESLEEIV